MKPLKSLVLVAAMAAASASPALADLIIVPAQSGVPFGVRPNVLTPSLNGHPDLAIRLRCAVQGTPSEFPNDIAIWRPLGGISAGTVVTWTLPYSGESGTVVLPAVPSGQVHSLLNVLPGGREAGTPCTIF